VFFYLRHQPREITFHIFISFSDGYFIEAGLWGYVKRCIEQPDLSFVEDQENIFGGGADKIGGCGYYEVGLPSRGNLSCRKLQDSGCGAGE